MSDKSLKRFQTEEEAVSDAILFALENVSCREGHRHAPPEFALRAAIHHSVVGGDDLLILDCPCGRASIRVSDEDVKGLVHGPMALFTEAIQKRAQHALDLL